MRYDDWAQRLQDYWESVAQKPFAYGEHDCLLAVSDAVHAMTGIETASEWRDHYSTEIGFLRLIKERGCDGLESLIEKLTADLAMREIGPRYAAAGDVVLHDSAEGLAFGIVHHNGRETVCVGPDGLKRVSILRGAITVTGVVQASPARRAWRVGECLARSGSSVLPR